jgi:hypothetical protein
MNNVIECSDPNCPYNDNAQCVMPAAFQHDGETWISYHPYPSIEKAQEAFEVTKQNFLHFPCCDDLHKNARNTLLQMVQMNKDLNNTS